jgi:integrase
MAEAGVPMAEIAQYLGHNNPAITYRVYARYSPTYLRGAANAVEFPKKHDVVSCTSEQQICAMQGNLV